MTTLNKYILAITFSFISFAAFAGGGWPQKKGEGYLKLSEWFIVANQHYTSQGLIDPNVTAGLFNTTFYGEYGITDRITGVVNFPFLSRATVNNVRSQTTQEIIFEGDALTGIGDLDLGLKYGIFQNEKVAISASLIAGLAIGESAGGKEGNLQLGDGEYNQLLRLDIGIPFAIANAPLYTNAYAGYNNRTNGFSDEFRFGGELGAGLLNKKLWIVGKVDVVRSTFNGSTAGQVNTSVFANNAEFVAVTAEVNYEIFKNFGLSISYGSAVSGKIIYAAPSYSGGIFYSF